MCSCAVSKPTSHNLFIFIKSVYLCAPYLCSSKIIFIYIYLFILVGKDLSLVCPSSMPFYMNSTVSTIVIYLFIANTVNFAR